MRHYKPTENQLKEAVIKALKDLRGSGRVTLNLDDILKLKAPKKEHRPSIYFTDLAYNKMQTLIQNCDKEIAWHGVVTKLTNKPRHYVIKDIIVYPQLATATTVESDDDKYPVWLEEQDDEVYNNIRFQGHSHVNMGASPSTTDTDYYETIIKHIKDYYIFFIMNKRGNLWVNLYDIESNLVFETQDIEITRESKGFDYDEWYKEQIKQVDEAYPTKYANKSYSKKNKKNKDYDYNDYDYNLTFGGRY